MRKPSILDGRLHSPFFVYFRQEPRLSDEQILKHFGLLSFSWTKQLQESAQYVILTDAGEWTLLADDWLYSLWHMPSTKTAIEALAESRDVFTWSVGDCDQSFEYKCYRDRELIRQYTVESPNYNDQVVQHDIGEAFEFEKALRELPVEERMACYCAEFGIETSVKREQLRLYSSPNQSRLNPNSGIKNL